MAAIPLLQLTPSRAADRQIDAPHKGDVEDGDVDEEASNLSCALSSPRVEWKTDCGLKLSIDGHASDLSEGGAASRENGSETDEVQLAAPAEASALTEEISAEDTTGQIVHYPTKKAKHAAQKVKHDDRVARRLALERSVMAEHADLLSSPTGGIAGVHVQATRGHWGTPRG